MLPGTMITSYAFYHFDAFALQKIRGRIVYKLGSAYK
ncbi:hypothetical protein Cflav_PD4722 [Pedosphaera parvula Ellin514]|uniref:Uncharacterized protein n=1 Tax=Pedosphaera parvula (strain Ellin514) TaxID=320771 RepID=B9XEG8_PEDPL|nr:hypothetical protein Cflav_PD4722 [Pedosphaera parvula Ellin514]